MKVNVKRKNYYLDERKIKKAKTILKTSTETQVIDAALDLVVFRKEILDSLEKVAGKGGVAKQAIPTRSAPVVLGIFALRFLFEFRIGFTPEERQVLGDLHRAVARRFARFSSSKSG